VGGINEAWSWQSARVIASTNSTLTVDPATKTAAWWFTGNGKGFLWGQLQLLDAENEWHLQTNSSGNTLYLRVAGGTDPSASLIEMKRRNWCLDLNGKNYVVVSGLNLLGGAVRLKGNGNVLQNCRGQFLSHFTKIIYGYDENGGTEPGGGVVISGNNNLVRGCTLWNTAGSGVNSSGKSNVITRNIIYNTDYSGTYACSIGLHGSRDVVTFNTAHTSGRDIVRPMGNGSEIQFNDFSDPGLLCKDLGVLYAWGINGQGASGPPSRIAFNWIHDNTGPSLTPLIYLDNWCRNFVVDHNVCWNSGGDAGVRINGPSVGHQIYNNTLFNCDNVGSHYYDQWPSPNPDPAYWTNDIYQYSATNNLFLATSPQAQLVDWMNHDFHLKQTAPGIDAGVIVAGFTEGYFGSAPDLGAYESGGLTWYPGPTSRPSLAIASSTNSDVILTASPDAMWYQLCAATNLTPAAPWIPVSNTPVTAGTLWSVTLSARSNVTQFYRLQEP
jgi:hypothetical protein